MQFLDILVFRHSSLIIIAYVLDWLLISYFNERINNKKVYNQNTELQDSFQKGSQYIILNIILMIFDGSLPKQTMSIRLTRTK